MAYKHDNKSSGQLIRSADWNLMGHEIERLETDKVNRAGDTIRGDLTVTGKAQLGSLAITGNASITGRVQGPLTVTGDASIAGGVLTVSGTSSSSIAGKLGIGTTSPTAQLSLGEWNSGNAGSSGDQATQLLLSGPHNQGANNGRQGQTTYKLKIEGYDNDGSTVYPIYCKDENELVDFWIKNRPSEGGLPTLYSAGNVGIGTTNPRAKLEVVGAGTTNAELLRVANSNTDYLSIQFAAAGAGQLQLISWSNGWNINTKTAGKHLYLNRDAAETSDVYIGRANQEICVKGNGNVGIGTTTPRGKLHISGDIGLGVDENNKKFVIHSRTGANGDYLQITHDKSNGDWDWGKGITLKRAQAAIGGNPAVETRVGIGTANPQAKLEVLGTTFAQLLRVVASDTDYFNICSSNAGGGELRLMSWSVGWIMSTRTDGRALYLNRDAPENSSVYIGRVNHEMCVKGNGNVGIGTTSPKAKLQIADGAIMPSAGNNDTSGIMFPRDPFGGTGDAAWIRYHNARGGEKGTLEIGISNDADDHIVLNPSGNVGIGVVDPQNKLEVNGIIRAVSFVNTSDERMKTDIQELHYGLNEILRLRPVSFNWKDIPNLHKSFGLVAQEVQPHIREVVYEEKDSNSGSCFSIAYTNLIPILINAIKELTNRLGELEKNLAADSIPSIGMG